MTALGLGCARFYTARVKNGCGARSTGTSAVPQIADDIGAPRKWSEVGQEPTSHPVESDCMRPRSDVSRRPNLTPHDPSTAIM